MTIEKLPDTVNGNAALVRRGQHFSDTVLIEEGDTPYLVRFEAGRVAAVTPVRTNLQSWTFAIRASTETWQRFWEPMPKPGYHDLIALLRYGRLKLEGNLQPLMANLIYFKLVLETLRKREGTR